MATEDCRRQSRHGTGSGGDYISGLPDNLLHRILLHLGPTRAAARTSVLSPPLAPRLGAHARARPPARPLRRRQLDKSTIARARRRVCRLRSPGHPPPRRGHGLRASGPAVSSAPCASPRIGTARAEAPRGRGHASSCKTWLNMLSQFPVAAIR
ncbi:unnamed protein product [Urochloa humidicola]